MLNAANEVAVDAFLKGRLGFLGIPALLKSVLDPFLRRHADERQARSLQPVLDADRWGRATAAARLASL